MSDRGRQRRRLHASLLGSAPAWALAAGAEPHGLTVGPQPGRYSLGHTGNLR